MLVTLVKRKMELIYVATNSAWFSSNWFVSLLIWYYVNMTAQFWATMWVWFFNPSNFSIAIGKTAGRSLSVDLNLCLDLTCLPFQNCTLKTKGIEPNSAQVAKSVSKCLSKTHISLPCDSRLRRIWTSRIAWRQCRRERGQLAQTTAKLNEAAPLGEGEPNVARRRGRVP